MAPRTTIKFSAAVTILKEALCTDVLPMIDRHAPGRPSRAMASSLG